MDNKSYLQVPGREHFNDSRFEDGNDKYTAAIDLSNKCREFYKSRLEAANVMKSKWREHSNNNGQYRKTNFRDNESISSHSTNSSSSPSPSSSSCSTSSSSSTSTTPHCLSNDSDYNGNGRRNKNSIDLAMERLRSEMVSLIDQDLSLMKQLLTLNETIEELKWQRQYYSCSTSCASLSASKNLDSNWSVSETEMYDSEDDLKATPYASSASDANTTTTTSTHLPTSGHVTGPTWHSTRKARKASKEFEKISLDSVSINIESVDRNNSQNNAIDGWYSQKAKESQRLSLSDDVLGLSGPLIIHDRDQNSFDSGIHEETVAGLDGLEWSV